MADILITGPAMNPKLWRIKCRRCFTIMVATIDQVAAVYCPICAPSVTYDHSLVRQHGDETTDGSA